jgi:hypothetical protein
MGEWVAWVDARVEKRNGVCSKVTHSRRVAIPRGVPVAEKRVVDRSPWASRGCRPRLRVDNPAHQGAHTSKNE